MLRHIVQYARDSSFAEQRTYLIRAVPGGGGRLRRLATAPIWFCAQHRRFSFYMPVQTSFPHLSLSPGQANRPSSIKLLSHHGYTWWIDMKLSHRYLKCRRITLQLQRVRASAPGNVYLEISIFATKSQAGFVTSYLNGDCKILRHLSFWK